MWYRRIASLVRSLEPRGKRVSTRESLVSHQYSVTGVSVQSKNEKPSPHQFSAALLSVGNGSAGLLHCARTASAASPVPFAHTAPAQAMQEPLPGRQCVRFKAWAQGSSAICCGVSLKFPESLLRYENGLFEPFIYKRHLFTKTGSGQT